MERLKRYLVETNTTQIQLAKTMSVSQPTVWAWVNGKSLPDVENLKQLSVITGITIDELVSSSGKAA